MNGISRKWMLSIFVVMVSIFALSIVGYASGGSLIWSRKNTGLEGGDIKDFVISPDNPRVFYALSEDALFKSVNRGDEWQFVHSFDLPTSIVIDYRSPNTIFVGTRWDGVLKSIDGGQTWQPSSQGITEKYIDKIVIAPNDYSIFYALAITDDWKSNIYQSNNGGQSWQLRGSQSSRIYELIVDPQNALILYAATEYDVLKSIDGGRSWNKINQNMEMDDDWVRFLTMAQTQPPRLYVGISSGEVYKSDNSGQSWKKMDFPADKIFELAVNPYNPAILFATGFDIEDVEGNNDAYLAEFGPRKGGPLLKNSPNRRWHLKILKSTDEGSTWQQIGANVSDKAYFSRYYFDKNLPNMVYVTDRGWRSMRGFYRSFNGGETWWPANKGMLRIDIRSLAVHPTNSNIIYAGGNYRNHGLYMSEDAGQTWKRVLGDSIDSIVIDPQHPDILYVGAGGVKKSLDGGKTWETKNTGLGDYPIVSQLAIDPHNSSILYGAMGGFADTLVKSTNGGDSWSTVDFPGCSSVAEDAPYENLRSSSAIDGDGVLGGFGDCIAQIWVDSFESGGIYVLAAGDIYKSTNGGGSWATLGEFPGRENPAKIVTSPQAPNVLWALGWSPWEGHDVLYKSENGGVSWTLVNDGLPGGWINTIVVDPITSSTIYLGSSEKGIYVSKDAGLTWQPVDNGLTSLDVNVFAFDPDDPTILYAGTEEQGVFVGRWMDYDRQISLPLIFHSQ